MNWVCCAPPITPLDRSSILTNFLENPACKV